MSAGDRGPLTSMIRHGGPAGLGEHPGALVSPGRTPGVEPDRGGPTAVLDSMGSPRCAVTVTHRSPDAVACSRRSHIDEPRRRGAGGKEADGRSSRRLSTEDPPREEEAPDRRNASRREAARSG